MRVVLIPVKKSWKFFSFLYGLNPLSSGKIMSAQSAQPYYQGITDVSHLFYAYVQWNNYKLLFNAVTDVVFGSP